MLKRLSVLSVVLFSGTALFGCASVGDKAASLSIVYLAAAILSLCVFAGYILSAKKKDFWFVVLFLSVLVVNVGYYLLSVSQSLSTALWANRLSYLGSVFLPMSMLMIILKVTKCRYKKQLPILLALAGFAVFAVAASPGYLDIYYKQVSITTVNGVTVLEKVYGSWHIIYLFYLFGYFAAMISAVIYATVKKRVYSVGNAVMLNIAVFVNIGVWLIEQLAKIDFEFLSVSYIISELFLLGLNLILHEQEKLKAPSPAEDAPQSVTPAPESASATQENGITPEQISTFKQGVASLTKTEKSIFDLYIEGKSTKEVLLALNIKENTLKYHNKNIYGKLGVSTRRNLLNVAKAAGIMQE